MAVDCYSLAPSRRRHDSVARSTSSAAAVDALYILIFLHLLTGNTTDTRRSEVGLLGLNTAGAAKLLITLLFPLGNQHSICVSILEEIVVELLADGFLLIVQVVDVSRTLMCDLEDGPRHLVLLLSFVGCILSVLHLVLEFEQRVFDVLKALRWSLLRGACRADWWHGCGCSSDLLMTRTAAKSPLCGVVANIEAKLPRIRV